MLLTRMHMIDVQNIFWKALVNVNSFEISVRYDCHSIGIYMSVKKQINWEFKILSVTLQSHNLFLLVNLIPCQSS